MNGTVTIADAGPYPYTSPMTATLIGYARCSTDRQDLDVAPDRIYTDHGLTGTTRARPCLDQALAAVRQGDTLVVPKLDRLASSVPDARAIARAMGKLRGKQPKLSDRQQRELSAACMPPASIPSAISPNSSPS